MSSGSVVRAPALSRVVRLARRATTLLAGAVVVAVLMPSGPASAHATLLFTSPAVDGARPDSPSVVQLVFGQPVVAAQTSLSVESADGEKARLGAVETGDDSSVVWAGILEMLSAGEYHVTWQVVARDGDAMTGDFRFVVGSGPVHASGTGGAAVQGAWSLALLRWMLFAGSAISLGGLVGASLMRRASHVLQADSPPPWLRAGAVSAPWLPRSGSPYSLQALVPSEPAWIPVL